MCYTIRGDLTFAGLLGSCLLFSSSSLFFFLWAHRPSAAISLLCQSLIIFSILAVMSLPTPDGEEFGSLVLFSILVPGLRWEILSKFLPQWTPLLPLSAYPTLESPQAVGMTLLYIKSGHDLPPSLPILKSLSSLLLS